MDIRKLTPSLLSAALPLVLYAYSAAPPLRQTGAPGEQNCSSCHVGNALNSPGGRMTIQAGTYVPGQKQKIRVTIEHSQATRWGFELTARVGESGIPVGTFLPNDSVRVRCEDGSELGKPAPCADGVRQYVTHTAESTMSGQRLSNAWEVEWTPPSEEVGDVVFYASGIAADGRNNETGDFAYTATTRIGSEAICGLTRKPSAPRIGNAATSQAGISANSLVSIYGADFAVSGTRRPAGPGDIRDGKFPTQLRCVAVEVAGQRVPITYVQSDQINIQMPSLTATGPVPYRVIVNPGPSEMVSDVGMVTVQNYSPAFLTFNGSSIAALHSDFSIAANPAVVSTGSPVRPGEVILLYGTGFGPSNPAYDAGLIVPLGLVPLRETPTVTIGGTTLSPSDILYAGVAPGSISGLYQLNVRVPASAPDGDIPVTVSIGGVSSPVGTTIPVRAPKP